MQEEKKERAGTVVTVNSVAFDAPADGWKTVKTGTLMIAEQNGA